MELDRHCDVTEEMITQADAIVIYKEYPHIDMVNRADDLFTLIADAAEGKTQPTMALYDCKMIGLFATPFEPMRGLVDEMLAMEGQDGILSVSLAHCFPWSNVPTCGAVALAITNGDKAKAEAVATEIGQKFFRLRHELAPNNLTIDEVLGQALAIKEWPVVAADRADNPGGGAPSDSTFVLRRLLERGIDNAALALMWDPIAVNVAVAGGVGATLDLRLGGKMGPLSGDPLRIPCGTAVCLHCNGIDIIVNARRVQLFGPIG